MDKQGCISAKDPAAIVRVGYGEKAIYYPCTGLADPERAWVCEGCPSARLSVEAAT